MWSLNSLANKAAEAINTAKKGISDMAKDAPIEASVDKKPEITMQMVKKQCLKFKSELEQKSEEINSYKKIIEEFYQEKKDWEASKINFKIIIGREDSEVLMDENAQKDEKISELKDLLDNSYKEILTLKENLQKKPLKLQIERISLIQLPSMKTIKDLEEKYKNAENTVLRISKEKEEVYKILLKKDEKIKILIDELRKSAEDKKVLDSLKESNSKLSEKIKFLSEFKEYADKKIENLSETLKFTKETNAGLGEKNENLNKRLKYMNTTINEKENLLKNLQEQASILKKELNESFIKYEELKNASENNIKDVKELYIKKIKDAEDGFNTQISDMKIQLSKALNEAKDVNIAKIQTTNYQRAVENLQEVVKNLEYQSSSSQTKLDKLFLQHENALNKIKKSKEKTKSLKCKIGILEKELGNCMNEFDLERQALIGKAREGDIIKHEAESLLKRIEIQIQASDNMIDKRIITNTLINYLSEKNNMKVKTQMLRALAEMLGFDQDQRVKIGLGQEQGIFSHLASFMTRS